MGKQFPIISFFIFFLVNIAYGCEDDPVKSAFERPWCVRTAIAAKRLTRNAIDAVSDPCTKAKKKLKRTLWELRDSIRHFIAMSYSSPNGTQILEGKDLQFKKWTKLYKRLDFVKNKCGGQDDQLKPFCILKKYLQKLKFYPGFINVLSHFLPFEKSYEKWVYAIQSFEYQFPNERSPEYRARPNTSSTALGFMNTLRNICHKHEGSKPLPTRESLHKKPDEFLARMDKFCKSIWSAHERRYDKNKLYQYMFKRFSLLFHPDRTEAFLGKEGATKCQQMLTDIYEPLRGDGKEWNDWYNLSSNQREAITNDSLELTRCCSSIIILSSTTCNWIIKPEQ